MGRAPKNPGEKKEKKKKEAPKAVSVAIPPRCTLKCRRKTEVVIVTGDGGMMFLCKVDADLLQKTGTIPKRMIPEKPKKRVTKPRKMKEGPVRLFPKEVTDKFRARNKI